MFSTSFSPPPGAEGRRGWPSPFIASSNPRPCPWKSSDSGRKTIPTRRRILPSKKRSPDLPFLVFKEFAASLNLIEDLDQLAKNILGKIREVCPDRTLALLVHDPDSGRFAAAAVSGLPEEAAREVFLSRDSRLVKWLKVNETGLDLARRGGGLEFLTATESEMLGRLGIAVCFPLISMNRLIGILLAGGTKNGAPLPEDEVSFISLLLPQAGIALENAILYREQRERLRRMSRADRLATVGELAAGAAHEIRNPLTAVRSSLQYLEAKSGDEATKKLIGTALRETNRINETVSALLAFSRPSEIVKEFFDLRETLTEGLDLIAYQVSSRTIAVVRDFPEPLPVRGDRAQLKQLFLNFFLNAVQAMPSGGTLRVEARRTNGPKLVVAVSDTGEGIPEDTLDRIFDPFFTTKSNGTGLGLSICEHIVKTHDGDIEVRSKTGRGTTMSVGLPLAAGTERA
ncbi:MAG: GAF domain-containing sensor histidine kinase [Candidatus Aminicenantales bacterium]